MPIYIEDSMIELNYSLASKAACHGITIMALQAFLVKEMTLFKKRLKFIVKTPTKEMKAKVNEALEYQKILYQKAKANLQSQLIHEWKLQVNPQQSFVTQLSPDKKNIYYQKLNEAYKILELNDINHENYIASTLPAFFDGVALYQDPNQFRHLFGENEKQLHQCSDIPFNLLQPIILENKHSPVSAKASKFSDFLTDKWIGIYSPMDLENTYSKLESLLRKNGVAQDIAFTVNDYDHILLIIYHHDKSPAWSIIENNHLLISASEDTIDASTLTTLSTSILNISRKKQQKNNDLMAISIKLYTNDAVSPSLTKSLNEFHEWQSNNNSFEHEIREATTIDFTGNYLIHIAIKTHDNIKAKHLLDIMLKHNINNKDTFDNLLRHAIGYSNAEMVLYLLNINIKPNLSGLINAIKIFDNIDIFKAFIATNMINEDKIYIPFIFACMFGSIKTVDYILKTYLSNDDQLLNPCIMNYNLITYFCKNKTIVSKLNHLIGEKGSSKANIISPLFLAALYGNNEIVKLLLKAGADPYDHYKNISPFEIANLMGYDAIADLMLPYEPLQHIVANDYNEGALNKLKLSINDVAFKKSLQLYHDLEGISAEILKHLKSRITFMNNSRNHMMMDIHKYIRDAYQAFEHAKNTGGELEAISALINELKMFTEKNEDDKSCLPFFNRYFLVTPLKNIITKYKHYDKSLLTLNNKP